MKSRTEQRQGRLSWVESKLALRMLRSPAKYFTSLEICEMTGCVSGRDKIRKLQANGFTIGPAKLLRISETGARIYGWRNAK